MTLYLDSASADDARRAAALGFVRGITTNPILMSRAGVRPADALPLLCDVMPGIVFHQLSAGDATGRGAEARAISALRPGRIGLKIPCDLDNLALASELVGEGLVVGITAIFDPAQAYLACEAGAQFVLPYVNRTTRLLGDGPGLVEAMRDTIEACGAPTEIIAASIKSAAEAVDTLAAGAHHLTLPLGVIEIMAAHELSVAAIAEFASVQSG